MLVSIHAPVMGATTNNTIFPESFKVSIHAPVMGATGRFRTRPRSTGRFNPRARDGRDAYPFRTAPIANVSIHAPVMGATPALAETSPVASGFNPRARDGRDVGQSMRPNRTETFQSTRP